MKPQFAHAAVTTDRFESLPSPPQSLQAPVSVMVPVLPPVSAITEFVAEIDRTHIYSNDGPLNKRFCREVADLVERQARTTSGVALTTVSNGTVAIDLALRMRANRSRRHVVMPAYTFIATAHAVANAGWEPFFVDVDECSLTLTPEIVETILDDIDPPAAVVVVSPFGSPVDVRQWESFEQRTGIPVVFDMAAAITAIDRVGFQPLCVSLHGTKMLGIGEGGAVLSTDERLIADIKRISSFGFEDHTRTSIQRGGNFRISEYAAAVGLASLRDLSRKADALRAKAHTYLREIAGTDICVQPGFGTEWIAMSANLILPSDRVDESLARFDEYGIQWRRWYSTGCHTHPAFAHCPKTSLPRTERIAYRTIGVPFHELLSNETIGFICRLVAG